MTSFKDREEGHERKFAFDEEQRFRAIARRNRMLGLWAAEKLGKTGAEADDYAKAVMMSDFQEPGDEDVFRKVMGDLSAGGIVLSSQELHRTMSEMLVEAMEYVKNT